MVLSSKIIYTLLCVSILCHFITIPFCIYLTVKQTYFQSEFDRITREITTNKLKEDFTNKIVNSETEDKYMKSKVQPAEKESDRKKCYDNDACGETVYLDRSSLGVTYQLQSPNYPRNYDSNSICHWNYVLLPRGRGLTFKLVFLDPISLEDGSKCQFDAIEVRTGSGSNSTLVDKFCGINRQIRPIIFSQSFLIIFKTDSNVNERGFRAQISVSSRSKSAGESTSAATLSVHGGSDPTTTPTSPDATEDPGLEEDVEQKTAPETSGSGDDEDGRDLSSPAVGGFRDVTYVRWGKTSCFLGTPYFGGYAVGFVGVNSQPLQCMPYPSFLPRNNITARPTASNMAALAPVKLNLQNISGALDIDINNRPLQCALCHARRTEVFTVIGWRSCRLNGEWQNAYTGYLMTSWKPNNASSTPSAAICVDKGAVVEERFLPDTQGPYLTYVQSGTGLWLRERAIPCAVCIKML